jgi:RHS repeat-associated protein
MTSSEVYVENLSSQAVWFDDLEIATGALPVAVVVQETHYDPWGLELAGIGYVSDGKFEHKFTYNGKEKQDQFGLGWLDYHARQVDPSLGRMWAVDPLAGKFTGLSPYVYVANNPTRMIDPDGKEFTDGAENWARRVENKADDLLKKNAKQSAAAWSKIIKLSREGRMGDIQSAISEMNDLAGTRRELENSKEEIGILRASSQLYDVSKLRGAGNQNSRTEWGGIISHNGQQRGVVRIQLNMESPNKIASAAHEFKHAFQFERGQMDFSNRGGPGALYDITDEEEAFTRGKAFGANANIPITAAWIRTLSPTYNSLSASPIDINTPHPLGGTYGFQAANGAFMAGRGGYMPNPIYRGWEADRQIGQQAVIIPTSPVSTLPLKY